MYIQNEEFQKYLKIVFNRRYLFLFVVFAVKTFVTFFGYLKSNKYRSECTVYFKKNNIGQIVEGLTINNDINETVKYFRYALFNRKLITEALSSLGSQVLSKPSDELYNYINYLQDKTNVESEKGNLFKISIVDSDPVFAQKYLNALVDAYRIENSSSEREESVGANKFLDRQLKAFKAKLDKAESAIVDFSRKQGGNLALNEEAELKDIKENKRELESIDLNLGTARARKVRLEHQLELLPATVDVLHESTGGNRLLELQKRLAELRLQYTDSYPEVLRLKTEIEGLKARAEEEAPTAGKEAPSPASNPLYQDLKQQLFAIETEISVLNAKKEGLTKIIGEKEASLREVPAKKKALGLLIQERDSYRQIYQQLLTRMGQAEVSRQLEDDEKSATFRVVEPAIFPQSPIHPNRARIVLVALVAGLACGFGLVVLLENLDSTVRETGGLEALGVEVLAVVPRIVDPQKAVRVRRIDYMVYGASGIYSAFFVFLLIYELTSRFRH